MEEEYYNCTPTRCDRENDGEPLYWVLKKTIAHYAHSEIENEHTVFIEELLALYRLHGTSEILERAWSYAMAHLYQGKEKDGQENAPQETGIFALSQTMLKVLVDEKGPSSVLDDLFIRYDRFFHKVAYGVLYDYELAQDGVMIAWEKVYRWLVLLSNDDVECEDPLPYLCKIVINASRTLRRKEYQQRMRTKLAGKDLEEQKRRTFETPEDALVRLERERIVREVVNQLPPKQRQATRLRYYLDDEVLNGSVEIEDERYAQIAEVTGRKETTLRSDMNRAKKNLRKLLVERGIQR